MLESTLQKVRTAASGSIGLTKVANQVERISKAAQGLTENGTKKLSNLATALTRLGQVGDIRISSSIGTQLSKIAAAAVELQSADLSKVAALADSLRPLSSLDRAHLTSYVNQLGQLPDVIKELNAADLDKFIANVKELNAALAPFAQNMEKISNGFAAFPSRIQRMIQSTEKYNQTMSGANKVSSGGLMKFLESSYSKYIAIAGVYGIVANTLEKFVNQSAEFNETMNLFSISMVRYAEEAYEYAQAVNAALGIDINEWMKNQGMFKQILSAFGVMEEKAYTMSKGLTQMAYDAASFYDITTEEAFAKLQSGIAGEIEPLRRLGVTLDIATLQQIAYNHGIEQSVNTMTQAQKSQLRYIAIMDQMSNAMGDLSRTILDPANAMRIFQSRLQELTREIGNLLIPLLMEIIPHAQAVVKALTTIVREMALLAGYQMPEIKKNDSDKMEETLGNITDSAEETTEALNELKNATLGIDELNVISSKTDAESGNAFDLPVEITAYDQFLDVSDEYKQRIDDLATDILESLQPISDLIQNLTPFFEAFVGEFETLFNLLPGFDDGGFLGWIQSLADWAGENPETLEFFGKLASRLVAFYVLVKLIEKIGELKAVKWLFDWFGKLIGKTDDLNDSYKKKNDTLEKQTEDTIADAAAVGVLAAAGVGLTAVLGGVVGWLKKNPLTPELNPAPVTASTAEVVRALEEGLTWSETRLGLNKDRTSEMLGELGTAYNIFAQDTGVSLQTVADASVATENAVAVSGAGVSNTLSATASSVSASTSSMEASLGALADATDTESSIMTELWDSFVTDFMVGADDVIDTHGDLMESWDEYVENFVDGSEESADTLSWLNSETETILAEISKTFETELETTKGHISDFTTGTENAYDNWASGMESTTTDLTRTIESAWSDVTDSVNTSISNLQSKMTELENMLIRIQELERKTTASSSSASSSLTMVDIMSRWAQSQAGGSTYSNPSEIPSLYPIYGNFTNPKEDEISQAVLDKFWKDQGIERAGQRAAKTVEGFFDGLSDAFSKFGILFGAAMGVPAFADGGYPDEGQLFIARERGAEMVGSIGGRTAVANNDQIVEAIRQGVYDAEMAARSRDSGGDTYVYIDGEEVATRVEKRRKDNGLSIYSGGVM